MPIPSDYLERVYAGVLGKLIGVYMGRPVENMRHAQIVERFGEVRYYLPEAGDQRIVATDDDIAPTLAAMRIPSPVWLERSRALSTVCLPCRKHGSKRSEPQEEGTRLLSLPC